MINLTDFDCRYADHAARVAPVDRESWMWEGLAPTAGGRTRRVVAVAGPMRRHLGGTLVRVGEWLQGTAAGNPATSMAARHTLDAVR